MNNHIQLVLKSSTTEMSLNDHESGIYLVPEIDGLVGLPNIRTTSGVNAGYDGGWTSAQNFDARSITIRGVIANSDVATVERMRKQLISLLAQGKNEQLTLNLVTEAGNAYELEVRTIACEMAMQTVLNQQQFMIQLRADDPLIYDGSATGESVIVQVQQAIGGFEINFELPLAISGGEGESVIENAGLEKVYPVINMYGALHNPTFVNVTTNQQIQVNATLGYAEGEWSTPSNVYEGKTITIDDAPDNAPLSAFKLDGETSQNGTPTPSAPVAVQTVTGENVVQICGKNLFDKNAISTGYLNADGTLSSDQAYKTSDFIAVKPNTAYYKTYTASPRTKYYNSTRQPLNTTTYQDISIGGAAGTFTTPANAAYVRFSFPVAGINLDTTQLELGSTATAYEPYQDRSYEVNLGKNLFDKTTATQNYRLGSDGLPYGDNEYYLSDYISVSQNTAYYISGTSGSAASDAVCFYASDKSFISRRAFIADWYSFTTPANTAYVRFTTQKTNDINGVQLELGSTATSYAAYFTPIELCKIGTYQDYIYESDGKWYVHKEVGKVILDGVNKSFSDRYTTASSHYRFVYTDQSIPNYTSGTVAQIYCNRLIGGTIGNTYKRIERIAYNDANNRLISYISSIEDSTVAAANTWLQSNPLDIVYILATATEEEITNEALISQLEAVLGGRTYAGVNNIFTITPNEQGSLEISYMTEKSQDRRDVIVIDSRMRTITLNGTDAYHLLAEGSEFPLLAPGENKLLLRSDTPGDNGYAEVNYKQGYLSI